MIIRKLLTDLVDHKPSKFKGSYLQKVILKSTYGRVYDDKAIIGDYTYHSLILEVQQRNGGSQQRNIINWKLNKKGSNELV